RKGAILHAPLAACRRRVHPERQVPHPRRQARHQQDAGRQALRAAQQEVGLADRCAAHKQMPLETHLQDYLRDVAGRRPTEAHAPKEEYLIRTILDGCESTRTQDLEGAEVADFLAGLRKDRPLPPMDPDKEWYPARV